MKNQDKNKKILLNQDFEEMIEQKRQKDYEEFMSNHFYCIECQAETLDLDNRIVN
ncbi:MAG TPA: hypothetical protein VLF93_03135 [Candidatus Saccharimonadales bacterium]|nr:hypothetical protein [Candidatus Saccharimonadales bacterium]